MIANNRIDGAFARLREQGRKAFIPYLACGVPGRTETVELVVALESMGADIVELGFPFSDPMADGPVNQAGADRALALGMDHSAYFEIVRAIRKRSQVPLVAFSYLNPIHKYGLKAFARDARTAGMDGILLVDMPIEESDEFLGGCRESNLHPIFLVAPTTTPKRLERILKESSGFLYYISRTGVTGERTGFQADFERALSWVKANSNLPVVVGFGISEPDHVRTVCAIADGVVVGSAIVRRTLQDIPFPAMLDDVRQYLEPLIAPTRESWT